MKDTINKHTRVDNSVNQALNPTQPFTFMLLVMLLLVPFKPAFSVRIYLSVPLRYVDQRFEDGFTFSGILTHHICRFGGVVLKVHIN